MHTRDVQVELFAEPGAPCGLASGPPAPANRETGSSPAFIAGVTMPFTPIDGEHDERRTEILQMSEKAAAMLQIVRDAFRAQQTELLSKAGQLGREIHRHEKTLMETLVTVADVSTRPRSDEDTVFVPMHLERVGDNLDALVGAIRKMIGEGILFTDRAAREMSSLFDLAIELLECVRDALRTGNRTLIRNIGAVSRQLDLMTNEFALFHEQRLIEGVCQPRASSLYLAMFDYLKGIEWHARQIGEKLAPAPLSALEPSPGRSERTKPV
jgi:Na+/phosphate symporter